MKDRRDNDMKDLLKDRPLPALAAAVLVLAVVSFPVWSAWLGFSPIYKSPSLSVTPVATSTAPLEVPVVTKPHGPSTYVEISESCGPYYQMDAPWSPCVNLRTDPSTANPAVLKLRTGMVLKTTGTTTLDAAGNEWYQIDFNQWLRYPERASSTYFVAASVVRPFIDPGVQESTHADIAAADAAGKRIVVDLSDQTLTAYEGDKIFMQEKVSTGLELTPTSVGSTVVYLKSPTRYMQGPTPISDQYFDLPGVPWDLYFTADGGAIHGAYWHNHFGQPWSHGCVNLPPEKAHELYDWTPVGTRVFVQE